MRTYDQGFGATAWVVLLGLWSVTTTGTLNADILELTDGRRFEGEIIHQSDAKITIDTIFGRTRVKLGFPASQVKSIKESALPPGFFDPPSAEPRVSDSKKIDPSAELYLEVPIDGTIGEEVYSDAIASILSYAKRHRIGHIVFHIDSSGGDIDEVFAVYDEMKRYDGAIKFHAIIKRCLGGPLAVALWCDSVFLLPRGVVGGLGRKLTEKEREKLGGDEESVLREELANQTLADTGRVGRNGEIVRAMLDPAATFFAWKDSRGRVVTGYELPADVERGDLVVDAPEGRALQLTEKQATALGLPTFSGSAADLGEVLKLDKWTRESNYGSRTMTRVAEKKQRTAKRKHADYERKVRSNVSRRGKTENYIERMMQLAAAWDPSGTTYETRTGSAGWGRGVRGVNYGYDTNQMTKESRGKWKSRTDTSIRYLKKAAEGLRSMKKLDSAAEKLGLEPTYKAGEVERMFNDIRGRIVRLSAERDRKVTQ